MFIIFINDIIICLVYQDELSLFRQDIEKIMMKCYPKEMFMQSGKKYRYLMVQGKNDLG